MVLNGSLSKPCGSELSKSQTWGVPDQGRSLGVKSGQIDPIFFGPMEKNGSGQKKKKKNYRFLREKIQK